MVIVLRASWFNIHWRTRGSKQQVSHVWLRVLVTQKKRCSWGSVGGLRQQSWWETRQKGQGSRSSGNENLILNLRQKTPQPELLSVIPQRTQFKSSCDFRCSFFQKILFCIKIHNPTVAGRTCLVSVFLCGLRTIPKAQYRKRHLINF